MTNHWHRKQEDLEQELQSHLEMSKQDHLDHGATPAQAEASARREFGNVALVEHVTRDQWAWRWVEDLLHDLRYSARALRKSPGFTLIAVLTLALGIGANTALFSVVNGVLFNPLPYPQSDRLVELYSKRMGFSQASNPYLNFLDWVRDNRSFSGLAAHRRDFLSLTGMGDPESLPTEMVSASFFPLLGVEPVVGRVFRPEEDQVGAGPVVLLNGGFWKRKFGSSPDAVGKTLTLNGESYTIIGVIPSSFSFDNAYFRKSDIYVPIGQWNDPTFRDRRAGASTHAVGRLKPGVSLAQAQADMEGVAAHLAEAYPDVNKGTTVFLVPLKEDFVGSARPLLLVLFAAVGFVLLIACTNIANLLLVRSSGRSREFAIRTALGAANSRLVRQLLTESVVLALIGGGLGVLLAASSTQAMVKALPDTLPRAADIHLDAHVLLFALVVSVLAGILFGLAPALRGLRADVNETLKEGGRGNSGVRHRMQRILVAVEMALAVVLLTGAGLMIRTLAHLWSVDPGFDPHHVATFNVTPPITPNESPEEIREVIRRIHDAVAAVPGVEYASGAEDTLPLKGFISPDSFWLESEPKPASLSQMNVALMYSVDPEALEILRIPLKRGRFLTAQDRHDSPPVMVIDEDFARLYFGNEDPIGKRVSVDMLGTSPEIVGVVGHAKQWGLDESAKNPVLAQFYFPLVQMPDRYAALGAQRFLRFVIRTQASPDAVYAPVRRSLEKVNSKIIMYDPESMDQIVSDSLAARRFAMLLLAAFAAVAVILASIGIYGVIAYLVGQRTHEIGIRVALGARSVDVLGLVLGHGMKMALVGVAIGLAAALGLTRLMESLLFGVSSRDPVTFACVTLVLVFVALVACYIPARRAMRVDPCVALRHE
jgi:predicted permease